MKIKQLSRGRWLFCNNEHAAQHANYKLHAALPVSEFDRYHPQIYNVLYKAVEEGIIPGFKLLNIGGSEQLTEELGGSEVTIDSNPRSRLINNPFTIYLHEDYDSEKVIELCQKIENILASVPGCRRDLLSVADLPLTPHLSFRQENLDGEYVKIAGAVQTQLQRLKKEGESSAYYADLRQQWANNQDKKESTAKTKFKEKINDIHNFYNNYYTYYQTNLRADDNLKKFHAACALLGLDYEKFINKLSSEERLSLLGTAYRQISLRFHPDKFGSIEHKNTQDRAKALFQLASDARDVLEAIAKEPELVDKQKILAQQPYKPKYQYELAERNRDFEETFFHNGLYQMVITPYVMLQKNWEFVDVASDVDDSFSTSTAIQLFKPQLTVYEQGKEKAIKVPGYEAFYLLYMEGNLPVRRFETSQFVAIMTPKNGSFTQAQIWLIQKFMETPERINLFAMMPVIIAATKAGIINVGTTPTDVMVYIYIHHPQAFKLRWFENEPAEHKIDRQQLEAVMLEQPQNLLQVASLDEVARLFPRVLSFMLESRDTYPGFSDRFLEKNIVAPCLAKMRSEIDAVTEVSVLQILNKNPQFISVLSTGKLLQLRRLITHNGSAEPTQCQVEFFPDVVDTKDEMDLTEKTPCTYIIYKQKNKEYSTHGPNYSPRLLFINGEGEVEELNVYDIENLWPHNKFEEDIIVLLEMRLTDFHNMRNVSRLPMSLVNQIDLELEWREHHDASESRPYVVADTAWYWHHEDPYKWICKQFRSGNTSVVFSLNNKTIKWLIEQPIIHWSDWVPFVEAFIDMDDYASAKKYLADLFAQLELKFDDSIPLKDSLSVVNQDIHISKLQQVNAAWINEKKQALEREHYLWIKDDRRDRPLKNIERDLIAFDMQKVISKNKEKLKQDLEGEANRLLERLESGEESEELLAAFSKLRGQAKEAGIWDLERLSKFSGNDFFELAKDVIGISIQRVSTCKDRQELHNRFGVNFRDMGFIEQLKRTYYCYQCLGKESDFYKMIPRIKGLPILEKVDEFNEQWIMQSIEQYLDDEFCVYIDGKRESTKNVKVPQALWFYSVDDIKAFGELHSLYERAGFGRRFLELVPNAYQRLHEAAKSAGEFGEDKKRHPLAKYCQMREYVKSLRHPILEDLAIQYRLKKLIDKGMPRCYNPGMFAFAEKRVVAIKDKFKWMPVSLVSQSAETISGNTQLMLLHLSEFLRHYQEKKYFHFYDRLMDAIRSDRMICEFLNIRIPREWNPITRENLAKSIIAAIDGGVATTRALADSEVLSIEARPPIPGLSELSRQCGVYLKSKETKGMLHRKMTDDVEDQDKIDAVTQLKENLDALEQGHLSVDDAADFVLTKLSNPKDPIFHLLGIFKSPVEKLFNNAQKILEPFESQQLVKKHESFIRARRG